MTTEELHFAVRTAIATLPNIPATAFEIKVTPQTVYGLHRRLPRQVITLNSLLRQCGFELTIRRIE